LTVGLGTMPLGLAGPLLSAVLTILTRPNPIYAAALDAGRILVLL